MFTGFKTVNKMSNDTIIEYYVLHNYFVEILTKFVFSGNNLKISKYYLSFAARSHVGNF